MSVQGLLDKLSEVEEEKKSLKAQIYFLKSNRLYPRSRSHLKLIAEPSSIPLQKFYSPKNTNAILGNVFEAVFVPLMVKDEGNMPRGQRPQGSKCNPAEVLLKLVLLATQSHFETPGILDEKRMSTILLMGKKVMEKSQRDAEARSVVLCNSTSTL